MPEKICQSLEETRLEQSLECNVQEKYMDIGSVLFNEYSIQCLGALAFLSLFPYGQGDPISNETIRDISSKETEPFAQKLCHLRGPPVTPSITPSQPNFTSLHAIT